MHKHAVWVQACMQMCKYVCLCVLACMQLCVCMYVCVCVCVCVCMRAHVRMRACVRACVRTRACMHTCSCIHACIHAYICMHACICAHFHLLNPSHFPVQVIDTETRKCLGVGERGELYMRGPMTMRGYHKNPQATASTIDSQGWIDTGQ